MQEKKLFLFGITMNPDNWDLVQIAFVGITGDKQHLKGINGLNLYLLNLHNLYINQNMSEILLH